MATITRTQIEQLMQDAQDAGDRAQVALCARALDGDAAAAEACAEAIADALAMDERHVASVPQVEGGTREVYAQDAQHARRARRLIADSPALIDHLHGVDGIEISIRDYS